MLLFKSALLFLSCVSILGYGPTGISETIRRSTIPPDIKAAFPQPIRGEGVRLKLLELLGLDGIPPAEVIFEAGETRETEDGLLETPVTFPNSLGETVPGLLLIPVGTISGSLSGVVCMSGTGGDVHRLTQLRFHRKNPDSGPLVGWGRELARRGIATLSISLKGTLARRNTLGDWETEAKLLAPYGRTQMGLLVEEALRASRILAARPEVDPNRIGLTGFSLGAYASWWAMACDPSIRTVACLAGGLGSLARDVHEGNPDRHSSCHYIPGLLRYFDHPQIVADCIAPRPFMMLAPLKDPDMAVSGVDALLRVVQPVYFKSGYPERLQVYRPDDGHVFRVKYFEWMVLWFQKHL